MNGPRLPPFYCPIPCPLHPNSRTIERRAIAWMDAFGLYGNETDRAWGIATHAFDHLCRACPEAPDERLLIFVQWMYWGFAVDDTQHDTVTSAVTSTARVARIVDLNLRIARGIETPGSPALSRSDPLTAALADLASRSRAIASPTQFRRLVEGIREWLFSVAWQASNVERAVMPTLADYAAIRHSLTGTRFHVALIEIANGTEVPGATLYSLPMQAAIEAAGFIVSCDNDLFGYAKDQDPEAAEPNIIDLLIHHRRCSMAEAVAEVVVMHDRVMTLFLALTDQLACDAGADVRLLLDSLRRWVCGSVYWHNDAPRYASPRNQYARPVAGASFNVTISDTPADDSTAPLPIPAIAWWWDQRRPPVIAALQMC